MWVFALPSLRIRPALGVGDVRRSLPSRVLAGYTWRHQGGKDSRVACPAEVGMESTVRRAQDKSGSTRQLMDL